MFQTYRTLLGYATPPNTYGAVVVAHAGEVVDGIRLPGEASASGADADRIRVDDDVWERVTGLADAD